MLIFEFILFFFVGIGSYIAFLRVSEKKALSIVRQKAQAKGNEAKTDQSERLMSFLMEVKQGFEESKSGGEDIQIFAKTKLIAIALKYPDVVMKHGKKLLKMVNSVDGLDGLLENGLSL